MRAMRQVGTDVSSTLRPSNVTCVPTASPIFCAFGGGVECHIQPWFAGAVASSKESIGGYGSGWLAFNGPASAKNVAVAFVAGERRSTFGHPAPPSSGLGMHCDGQLWLKHIAKGSSALRHASSILFRQPWMHMMSEHWHP
jgi:hypothetical protein